MRTLDQVEKDLVRARESLSSVEGTEAEVYSRIVGYYRSVRNWNRGKREEYGERRLYDLACPEHAGRNMADGSIKADSSIRAGGGEAALMSAVPAGAGMEGSARVLLFWRQSCPACPSAKEAAGRLGIPVDLVNADTETGFAEARKRNVLATPTAIFLSPGGTEIGRARDSHSIAAFGKTVV